MPPPSNVSESAESTPRGRVLVIADPALADEIADVSQRSVTVVESIYDALGELATTDLLHAPDAVIGSIRALGSRGQELPAAIRRVDPSVRVIAVADSNGEDPTRALLEAGFDACVSRPLTRLGLERAIREGVARQAIGPADERTAPKAGGDGGNVRRVEHEANAPASVVRSASPVRSAGPMSAPRPTAVDTPQPDVRSAARDAIRDAGRSAAPSLDAELARFNLDIAAIARERSMDLEPMPEVVVAEPDLSDAGDLGDVDLIEHLVTAPEDLPKLALRIVARQTGWKRLRLRPDPAPGAVPIECRGRRLGYLQCDEADEESLRAWASWAGHWLELDWRLRSLRRMAYCDDLTDACNRRYFDAYLDWAIADARRLRIPLTLMIFDIDDFKRYNDRFGHGAGDDILIETVRLLRSVIRPSDKVCRIGGDEFAVIFYDPQGQRVAGSHHPDDIVQIARRFQEQICRHRFPKLAGEAPGQLTISGGLANFPWDAGNAAELVEVADQRAMESKRSGKNAITVGPRSCD